MAKLDWDAFCREFVPGILTEWGAADAATAVGEDLLVRARSCADSGVQARDVLRAPFTEEVYGYQPRSVPIHLRADVCVVVRCGLLEDAHALGLVEPGGIEALTTLAAVPLAEWLNDHHPSAGADPAGSFDGIDSRWPRAWAAFSALGRLSLDGGRAAYIAPDAPASGATE